MTARGQILQGSYFGGPVRSHYQPLSPDAFPECRHCARLVSFREMRDHILEHGLDPRLPYDASPLRGVSA